jgi:hypothetical protein
MLRQQGGLMKFWYDWAEPSLAKACHRLEEIQVTEEAWRATRRRASIAVVLLTPLLVVELAASFAYLTRAQVSGWGVYVVCLLGGLLGGMVASLRRLSALTSRRRPPEDWGDVLWPRTLYPLAAGSVCGTASAALIIEGRGDHSYRPQTLYLFALAFALVLLRLAQVRVVKQ